jgi:hypothetical protein
VFERSIPDIWQDVWEGIRSQYTNHRMSNELLYYKEVSTNNTNKQWNHNRKSQGSTHPPSVHPLTEMDVICSGVETIYKYNKRDLTLVQYIYIQGVPGGTDLTSGECSLGQTIPI